MRAREYIIYWTYCGFRQRLIFMTPFFTWHPIFLSSTGSHPWNVTPCDFWNRQSFSRLVPIGWLRFSIIAAGGTNSKRPHTIHENKQVRYCSQTVAQLPILLDVISIHVLHVLTARHYHKSTNLLTSLQLTATERKVIFHWRGHSNSNTDLYIVQ